MPKKQMHIRASAITQRQISELAEQWGTTITDVITIAVDRLYREEHAMDRTAEVNRIRELAGNIAANLGEGTAEELVEYALSDEGRESWGIDIDLDDHDRALLTRFVAEALE